MLLNEQVRNDVKKAFESLKNDVKLVFFTQTTECNYCEDTGKLINEVAALSDKIGVEIYNFVTDREKVEKYGIDKIPAIAVVGKTDHNIRFYGIPAGYEFQSLIEAIRLMSGGESALSPATKQYLEGLQEDVHLQVFVTPTCPHCPRAVMLAHQLAFYSPRVRADMVESIEFPHLANLFVVRSVPKTIINDSHFANGALPEALMLDKIKDALK